MKKETISKINQMADFILSSCEDSEINKVIKKLDGIKTPSLLRRFVVKDVVAKNFNKGNEEAILTIEEYTEYLFPDTNSWREIRDVLLIALYQKMHERNMSVEIELDEDINE
jgi:CRISPR-associated protein Cst1